jgi:hypothetical protein
MAHYSKAPIREILLIPGRSTTVIHRELIHEYLASACTYIDAGLESGCQLQISVVLNAI